MCFGIALGCQCWHAVSVTLLMIDWLYQSHQRQQKQDWVEEGEGDVLRQVNQPLQGLPATGRSHCSGLRKVPPTLSLQLTTHWLNTGTQQHRTRELYCHVTLPVKETLGQAQLCRSPMVSAPIDLYSPRTNWPGQLRARSYHHSPRTFEMVKRALLTEQHRSATHSTYVRIYHSLIIPVKVWLAMKTHTKSCSEMAAIKKLVIVDINNQR